MLFTTPTVLSKVTASESKTWRLTLQGPPLDSSPIGVIERDRVPQPRAKLKGERIIEQAAQEGVDLSRYRDGRGWRYFAMRGLWACVQLPFFPKMPKYLSPIRIALLRLFGARIGKKCKISGGTRIWVPGNLVMADNSVIGEGVKVYNLAPISIGANAVVSQYTYLCSATHDHSDPAFRLLSKPIVIHGSAWVAANVFISPGVTVGQGAVVGACSVVTKDVPAWMICAGNPCRPLKPRILREQLPQDHGE